MARAIGILTTCFVAAAWEQRTWFGARTRLGRAGTVLAAFGWLLGCMAIFGPAHDPHDSDVRRQFRCASNLQQIGFALSMYANNHGGQFPDRLEELLSVPELEPRVFVCPSTDDVPATGQTSRDIGDAFASGGHLSYVYIAKGLTTKMVGAQHVLVFEPMQNHTRDHAGIHVLFGDGRVEFVVGDSAQKLTDSLRRGENPPTGWR